MTSRTIRSLALALALIISLSTASYAGISDAAMLFLRIAPGARAAALGEAYVAVADDATATHWNPAGLGSFPLSADWLDSEIPMDFRPLIDIAAVKIGRGVNYLDYDLWAITSKGLKRYDNRQWHNSELFSVPSTTNLDKFVGRYFGIIDDVKRAEITFRVAQANNTGSLESLEALKDSIVSLLPDTYSPKPEVIAGFDSLLVGYKECRIDWNYISALKKHLSDGLKDDDLSEREMDQMRVAIERAHLRYIQEEINIPFSALFENPPTLLESNGEVLLVSSDEGLFQLRKSVWKRITIEDGLPSENILSLKAIPGGQMLIGTDQGLVVHTGAIIQLLNAENELPEGRIDAISATGLSDIWVVMNDELYNYNNSTWSNSREYTVILDDDIERIANKYQIYGTPTESLEFLTKLAGIDQYFEPEIVEETKPVGVPQGQTIIVIDSIAAEVPDSTEIEEVVEPVREFVALPDSLLLGSKIRIPLLASIKGEIYDIHYNNDVIWLGTEYGVLRYDNEGWEMPGWKEVVVDSNVSWDNLISLRSAKDRVFAQADTTTQEKYLEAVRVINDLDGSQLQDGQTIRIYNSPNAYPVYRITEYNDDIFFVSETGLLQYNSSGWGRAGFKNLGNANVDEILTIDDEIWFLTDQQLIAKGRGRSEISLMHANWLPAFNLDDLYYDYFGFVTSNDKIGTFGGNLTFISLGEMVRTSEQGDSLGVFDVFEFAATVSYGASLSKKLSAGVSAKIINSHLSEIGAANEKGNGVTWAFALDFGFIYKVTPALNLGLAITNLGPDVQYSDHAQKDALPRNIAFGFAYKAFRSDELNVLVIAEANKSLVNIGDPRDQEIKEIIWSGGIEVDYLKLIAFRGGYYHDQEGKVKNVSFGAGLRPMELLKIDFAYIPGDSNVSSLANTLRLSLSIFP